MSFDSQDFEIMQLVESSILKPIDFFKQVLDCPNNNEIQIDFLENQKKAQDSKYQENVCEIEEMPIAIKQTHQNANVEALSTPSNVHLQILSEKQNQKTVFALKNKRRFFSQKNDTSKRSTRCVNTIQEGEMVIDQGEKMIEEVVHFVSTNTTEGNTFPTNKNKKIKKRFEKHIMKEKSFGKTLKLSFPKKLVEMFLNHYQKFEIENEDVRNYNNDLKSKLKQSKKNDYTFEKEVSQILGYNNLEDQNDLCEEVSRTNRKVFSEIISSTMKEQVIMRDKIAKNRELYMIQLKVYSLRCRSEKLSKKGTFK